MDTERINEGVLRGRVFKNLMPATSENPLGVILAFVAVSWKRNTATKELEPYFDWHDENITDGAIIKASYKFAMGKQRMLAMHQGAPVGEVLWSFPMTRDVAQVFKFVGDEYGWLIGIKPNDAEVARKCANGEYTGLSLGGWSTKYVKPYDEKTCPECRKPLGVGNCPHQPAEAM